jgi:metallo-beta-lactamase family protein
MYRESITFMKITFLGATETVTGSKYLLTLEHHKVLVDCGLFQGYKELRLRNWANLPIDPKTIDAVILTHAHIDHSGYIPLLIKNGFSGKVYCTHATKELCEVLLPDSGYLQEEEAAYANKRGSSKHTPALPLYTLLDAEHALKHFHGCDVAKDYRIFDDLTFQFNRAGHILGAATALLKSHDTSILFSGDLGRPHDPIMLPPVIPPSADYLVLESTYGDRSHEPDDPMEILAKIINKTAKRGGTIIIPAFAVGRAQSILYFIYQLKAKKHIANLPIFLDSPMATDATEIFCRHPNEHRLSKAQCHEIYGSVNYIHSVLESQELDGKPMPKIIVSASGMATGGRVLHHIKALASDKRNAIIFTGFQAGGTRGDRLTRGEREIKIFGEMIRVNAEVILLNNLSAHADREEILGWLSQFQKNPRKVFITHGEPEAAATLKTSIKSTLKWHCIVPKYGQEEKL